MQPGRQPTDRLTPDERRQEQMYAIWAKSECENPKQRPLISAITNYLDAVVGDLILLYLIR